MTAVELERCEFIWTLKNFSFFPCTDAYYLRSPIFRTKSRVHWNLSLNFAANGCLTVYLTRSEGDEGPSEIDVKYELSVNKDDKSKLVSKKYEEKFERLSSRGMSVPEVNPEIGQGLVSQKDELVVTCDMFLFAHAVPQEESSLPPPSIHLRELAKDLSELYKTKKYCDINLHTMEGVVPAHKCVLMARSPYFMRDHKLKCIDELKFPQVPKQLIEKLLWFMYSGEFELLDTDVPTFFTLFELINTCEISFLQELMVPKKIYANTEIEIEQSEFTWLIRDFSLYENWSKAPVTSPQFRTGKEVWFFKIFPSGCETGSEHIGLKGGVSNLDRKVLVDLEISVRSEDNSEESVKAKDRRTARLRSILETETEFIFPDFVEKEFFECCRKSLTTYDTLTLDITVKISSAVGLSVKSEVQEY